MGRRLIVENIAIFTISKAKTDVLARAMRTFSVFRAPAPIREPKSHDPLAALAVLAGLAGLAGLEGRNAGALKALGRVLFGNQLRRATRRETHGVPLG